MPVTGIWLFACGGAALARSLRWRRRRPRNDVKEIAIRVGGVVARVVDHDHSCASCRLGGEAHVGDRRSPAGRLPNRRREVRELSVGGEPKADALRGDRVLRHSGGAASGRHGRPPASPPPGSEELGTALRPRGRARRRGPKPPARRQEGRRPQSGGRSCAHGPQSLRRARCTRLETSRLRSAVPTPGGRRSLTGRRRGSDLRPPSKLRVPNSAETNLVPLGSSAIEIGPARLYAVCGARRKTRTIGFVASGKCATHRPLTESQGRVEILPVTPGDSR